MNFFIFVVKIVQDRCLCSASCIVHGLRPRLILLPECRHLAIYHLHNKDNIIHVHFIRVTLISSTPLDKK